MDYILEATDLCKKYKDFKVLNRLSIHIPKGSIYGLVGKNGAGKTTLIRIICGLQMQNSGNLFLYGKSNKKADIIEARRRIGAVVETPSIYLNMTARQNIEQQYLILGMPSFDGIDELLKLVGLEKTGKKKAKNFSLGMRQRLAIAIALAGNPDFIILDEPINGLDPQGIVEIRELILELNRNHNITVLISSHILDELSKLATHYGFLDSGHIVKEISAQELEKNCRKAVRVEVNDIKALAVVLDEMKMEYTVISDTQADIYSTINVSALVLKLSERDCTVYSMQERDESLESFYISLVGGGNNA